MCQKNQGTKNVDLTLYDPGGGGLKPPPSCNFCPHAFNFGATVLYVGDFSQNIVYYRVAKVVLIGGQDLTCKAPPPTDR